MPPGAKEPRPPELPSQLEQVPLGVLAQDARYEEIELANAAIPDQHAGGVSFQTARLTNVDVSGSRLESLTLADSKLIACNLANVQAGGAGVRRTTIETTRSQGSSFRRRLFVTSRSGAAASTWRRSDSPVSCA